MNETTTTERKKPLISLLVATDINGGIAKVDPQTGRGKIPWPTFIDDRRWMKGHIQGKVLVMGRNTFEELNSITPPWFNSDFLHGVIVVSKSMSPIDNGFTRVIDCVENAIKSNYASHGVDFVIFGGARVYNEALSKDLCDSIFMTVINEDYQCDIKFNFPDIDCHYYGFQKLRNSDWYTISKTGIRLDFSVWVNSVDKLDIYIDDAIDRSHVCHPYRKACLDVFTKGIAAEDRTLVGTRELKNLKMTFDLSRGTFPFDGALRECSWDIFIKEFWYLFIKAGTNAHVLNAMGVPIWNKDTAQDREVPDGNGGMKILREGDMGPMYGFVMRHYGADYVDCNTDYTGKGMDQLKLLIDKIRSRNPSIMRRMAITTFDAKLAEQSVLWPCHGVWTQFVLRKNESGEEFLDCITTQRSADMALGVPYNIAQYALLLLLIAKVTKVNPGTLDYNMYQAHIYSNHIAAMRYMLSRRPIESEPRVELPDIDEIDQFHYKHAKLIDYKHNGHVPLLMNTVIPPMNQKRKADQV